MGPPKSYAFDFKGKITAKIFLWFRKLSASFGRLSHFEAAGAVFDLRAGPGNLHRTISGVSA
jgi:hypothetical protein